MLKIASLTFVAFSLVACVDDTTGPDERELAPLPASTEITGPTEGKADTDDTCHVLPTSDACAVACDEEALQELIPPGTCILFRCQLDDGSEVGVGGCRPE